MDHADFKPKGFDEDSWVDEKRRTPFAGLQIILYLRAGTDSAQPIRVPNIPGSGSQLEKMAYT